jgi:hypothetical protein
MLLVTSVVVALVCNIAPLLFLDYAIGIAMLFKDVIPKWLGIPENKPPGLLEGT